MTPHRSLLIPARLDAGTIALHVGTAITVLARRPATFYAMFVNEGSTRVRADGIAGVTGRWLSGLSLPHAVGQGIALRTGPQAAGGDRRLTMDGDGRNDPPEFPILNEPVEHSSVDLACGGLLGLGGRPWRKAPP